MHKKPVEEGDKFRLFGREYECSDIVPNSDYQWSIEAFSTEPDVNGDILRTTLYVETEYRTDLYA